MAIRTKLLNGNNITRDTDFSKFIQTVSEPWVIEGFTVTASSVAVWQARVPCERTNGETLYALIYNTAPVSISGNGEVYILVNQTYIDDGELANEDGTGIATIVVGTTPSKNALKLATITGGVVTDNRNIIPKVWELKTYIQSLQDRMNTVESEVDYLTNETADSLKESWIIAEKYILSDKLVRQKTPTYDNSNVVQNIWDENANAQIHIQRIWSWVASNKIRLKAKYVWSPTTWLTVEVRRWVQVDVSDREAYWYWGDLVCSWTIPYSSITNSWQMFEVTMNWQFWWTKWEILDIVVYMTWNIVNASNYYQLGCDWSQNSEWFSLVKVNWDTRTRSNLCPFCIWDWFLDKMLVKVSSVSSSSSTSFSLNTVWNGDRTKTITYTTPQQYSTLYITAQQTSSINYTVNESSRPSDCWNSGAWYLKVSVWWTEVLNISAPSSDNSSSDTVKLTNVASWTVIEITQLNAWYHTQSYPWTAWYYFYQTAWVVYISPTQSTIIKPLIPTEVKAIWQLWFGISYWRLDDWTWYGEFDWETSTTAITWNVALWNCLGFKTITDSNGEKYKVPVYWV